MRHQYANNNVFGGITGHNRVLLDKLNNQVRGPFGIDDAVDILGLQKNKTKRLINFWAFKGWLTRIKRGLYTTVPLGAENPKDRKADPWIIASKVFSPCYIGGWSACEHWGLSDQIFKDIVVFSTKKIRRKKNEIQGITYIVRRIKKEKYFGFKPVWREQIKVSVSDLEKTIVDILDEPYLGGGIRNVALILKEYFVGKEKEETKLFEYIEKCGNKAVYKRLGYLIEVLNINAAEILKICRQNMSVGDSKLDPTIKNKGKRLRRWNLVVNANIGTASQ
jgi:predicted transcriptional regulator of viral defense system